MLPLDSARITEFHITQRHTDGRVYVNPFVETGEKTTHPVVAMEFGRPDYETKAQLCIINDTLQEIVGVAVWALRNRDGVS